MSGFDFNDAEKQRGIDLIPNGTIVRLVGTIRPGGASRDGNIDAGWLTQSKSSDSKYLNWEFVVSEGPYRNRRLWQNMTVFGGETNEKGESKGWNITKSTVRAMLNSARNVKPDDESQQALAARRINNWGDINGIEFLAKVSIRKGQNNYPDQNQIATVIEPGHKDYVAPGAAMPATAASSASSAPSAPTPAWAAGGQAVPPPAAASAVPAWAR